jgi:hypothetical protein
VTLLFGASVLVSAFASFGNNALNGNGANGRFTSTAALNRSNRNDEDAAVGGLFQWHKRLPLLALFRHAAKFVLNPLLGVKRKSEFRGAKQSLAASATDMPRSCRQKHVYPRARTISKFNTR